MRAVPFLCHLASVLTALCGATDLALGQRPPEQLDGAAILHRMQKLGVLGSVLYVAAHPDDENTRLISYLSNGRQVRTAYLSLTRGGGGQNLIGPELGDALGILRTQELFEARRIDGGEQFFTRAVDFGYSKNSEETLAKWGKAEVLADVVRVVRTFRPDVIVTRFASDGSGGHGHHTASALLAHEAFDLAADPLAFPEQLTEGLAPWQVKRVFFNGSTWWKPNLAEQAQADPKRWLRVNVGGYNALLGTSYTELAGRSRSQHKSQGFGSAETRGDQFEYLRVDKGAQLETPDLFDGLELGWARVGGAERVGALVNELLDSFDPRVPESSIAQLGPLLGALRELAAAEESSSLARAWARHHGDAARELLLQIHGVVLEFTAERPSVAQGETLPASLLALRRRGGAPLRISSYGVGDVMRDFPNAAELPLDRPYHDQTDYPLAGRRAVDQPYWLAAPHGTLYRPDGMAHFGIEPISIDPSPFRTTILMGEELAIEVERSVMHTWVERVAGQRTRPFVVTLVASIKPADTVAIVTGEYVDVSVELEALTDDLVGHLEASGPVGWAIEPASLPIEGLRRGERRRMRVRARRTATALPGMLRFSFSGPKGTSARTLHVIDYPHILPQTWYTPAQVRLVPLDVEVSVGTVGYIEGVGDDVPNAIARLGVSVESIDPSSAQPGDLQRFDAIVTGIRAYNKVTDLAHFQPALLAYVENGGTLLVQYNTAGRDLVLESERIGPYPFTLTRGRVTVEQAPATLLAPGHPLLTTPNRIGEGDFAGWVQERGLYFAGELDPRYTPLIAWSDPGEEPLNGALITCDHGKGRFTYTGLSLFRQLPAGVPGAYRLLANLLARRTAGE